LRGHITRPAREPRLRELVAKEQINDPKAPVKGLASVHFAFTLARAGSMNAAGGRVGADPGKLGIE
jgi:hypothetical protein